MFLLMGCLLFVLLMLKVVMWVRLCKDWWVCLLMGCLLCGWVIR